MGFPRQEYWSGLPFLSPGDLPNSGIKPESSVLASGFFTTEPLEKPILLEDRVTTLLQYKLKKKKQLSLFPSAKSLWPHKVTGTGSGD